MGYFVELKVAYDMLLYPTLFRVFYGSLDLRPWDYLCSAVVAYECQIISSLSWPLVVLLNKKMPQVLVHTGQDFFYLLIRSALWHTAVRTTGCVQCVLVSEEDEEASYLDRKLRGKCVKNLHSICSAHKLDMVEQFYFCCFWWSVRVALHFPSGTVSALIPWMAPPTSTAACPSEWYAHK